MELKRIGNIMPTRTRDNPNQGRVYQSDEIAPTITAGDKVPMIVSMRGRNPDNPSDRTVGTKKVQRLEPNSQGICNTITSVQKDNLVMEGNFNQRGVVHRVDGICRTLMGSGHSGNEPKILIKQATKEGYIECEPGGVADLSFPKSNTRRGRVQDKGKICPTLTSAGSGEIYKIESRIRIRKLTQRECGRLMGVSDDNITKMVISNKKNIKQFFRECEEKGIRYKGKREFDEAERIQRMSNSQLYKQYGNSIVVPCMVAMFSNLNIQGLPRWDDIKHRYIN